MCYRRSWAEKPKDMEKKVLYKIHSEVVNKKLNEIVLGGIGEPTYSPLIYDAISLFSSFNLTITTNGTLLDDKLKSLIVDNVNKIVVSIDGLEDKYKDIRGFNLKEVLENLKDIYLIKRKNNKEYPHVVIQFVASKDNIEDIFSVLDIAETVSAYQVIISNVIPQTEDYKDKILYTRYENKFLRIYLKD